MKLLFFIPWIGLIAQSVAMAGGLEAAMVQLVLQEAQEGQPAAASPLVSSDRSDSRAKAFYANRKGTFEPRKSAEKCSKVEGIQEKLGEVRNQDGLGWCFADVVADILGFEVGKRLSDFDIGLRAFTGYGPEFSVADLNAASPIVSLRNALRDGVCTEENLPANERMIAELARRIEQEGLMPAPKKLGEMNTKLLAEGIRALEKVRGQSLAQLLANENRFCQAFDAASVMFPSLSEFELLSGITTTTTNEALFRWLVKRSCVREELALPEKFRFTEMRPGSAVAKNQRGFPLLPALDKALARGKPVQFAFWPNRFFAFKSDDRHVALIVGREFRNGTCQYLVRNSFGPGCGYYKEKYAAPGNCQRGHFWITEEDFVRTAENVGFVE